LHSGPRWGAVLAVLAVVAGVCAFTVHRALAPAELVITLEAGSLPADGFSSTVLTIHSSNGRTLRGLRVQVENPHRVALESLTVKGDTAAATLQAGALPGDAKLGIVAPGFAPREVALQTTPDYSDAIGDGTPDFLRLHDPADRLAFRHWFTLLAESQYYRSQNAAPEIDDCAALWLLNLFGNAVLIAAVYFWLLLPDAHGAQVAASAGLALLEWGLLTLLPYTPQFGVWWWQKLPALRFGSPRTVFHTAQWVLWIVMGLLPAIWLPVGSTVAASGLKVRRMTRSLRLLTQLQYWLWYCGLAFVGVYVPYRLIWWIPDLDTLSGQAWSAGLRFAAAYVIVASAWVALLLVIGDRLSREDPLPIEPSARNSQSG
jgi:hypothetical protein